MKGRVFEVLPLVMLVTCTSTVTGGCWPCWEKFGDRQVIMSLSAGVWSSTTLTSVAAKPPKVTWTGTLKPEPKRVTRVPPSSGPAMGDSEASSGCGSSATIRKA